jgi:hypothetical protein
MAKRSVRRRKVAKPEFIEVDGHQLTRLQHAQFLQCVETRKQTNSEVGHDRQREMALGDFLSPYRPSKKIEVGIIEAYRNAANLSIAIGNMSKYPFSLADGIRHRACELLRKLAIE